MSKTIPGASCPAGAKTKDIYFNLYSSIFNLTFYITIRALLNSFIYFQPFYFFNQCLLISLPTYKILKLNSCESAKV